MENHWDGADAGRLEGELGPLIYATRLLGSEASLNLYGSGNTSAKLAQKNLLGEDEQILYIDNGLQPAATVEISGFTPVRCKLLANLIRLQALPGDQLANELACSRTLAAAPVPPPEAVLHAALPYPYILSAQPDAMLAVANTPNGPDHLRELYGETVPIVPYSPTGLALARTCTSAFQPETTAMVVMYQGVFTYGETAYQAYERMVDLVSRAERALESHGAWSIPAPEVGQTDKSQRQEVAALRRAISEVAGRPLILTVQTDPVNLVFSRRDDVKALASQGPAVARHIAMTRRMPMIGRDVGAYRTAVQQAYEEIDPRGALPRPDPAPRIVLDPEYGLCALGDTAGGATLAGSIYRHTIDTILRATILGGYQTLPPAAGLQVESASFPTTPSPKRDASEMFRGEVALVTGGASGIGKACVESLLARGAAVANMDINPRVVGLFNTPAYLGLQCDLTDEAAIMRAFETMVKTFGGLDMLVLNAGIFPAGVRIESLSLAEWQKVMRINLDSNLVLLREAYPLLKLSPLGGRVLVNASKNVLAPGAGAAAYSSSKAAVTQLARVAALEWGKDHIRVNMVHPDAIFDTGIWTEDVLKARAAHYGMTVQQYKTRNVLGVELNSHYVGELVAEMLGPRFEKITGAQIPVDGGSDRVI